MKILHCGHNVSVLREYPDDHFHSIVTDPPYGIEFLGKAWDQNTGATETWQQCLRVLKPGGYLLAFSSARTYHRLAHNIESVGFDIRDQIMWIYSSGFPKAQDVGKNIAKRQLNKKNMSLPSEQWSLLKLIQGNGSTGSIYQHPNGKKYRQLRNTKTQRAAQQYGGGEWTDTYEEVLQHDNQWSGWKTQLKPGHEPIVMARKPFRGSTTDNVLAHGVGALNIDATRISVAGTDTRNGGSDGWNRVEFAQAEPNKYNGEGYVPNPQGRYPSNVLGEIPDYQKYFYCPKVSRGERHCGFEQEQMPDPLANYSQGDVKNHPLWDASIGTNLQRLKHKILEHQKSLGQAHTITGPVGNNHPTVKPVALMRYLIQLVTPVNSLVLDPFMGSGSTGMAACELGHRFVGIDLDPHYVEIADRRIEGWVKPKDASHSTFNELFD